MKYLRATLIALAVAVVSIGFGATSAIEQGGDEPAACQKCGDGFCARSCENERTCPQDCGPSTAH